MFYPGTTCLRGLLSTTRATTNKPEASEVLHLTRNHHHVPNHLSNFTKQPKKNMTSKTASHFDPRLPTFSQCAKRRHACHVDQKNVRCPAPVTHNKVSDFNMSQKVPRLLTQHGHCSKNKHGALVKRELWKNGLQIPSRMAFCEM